MKRNTKKRIVILSILSTFVVLLCVFVGAKIYQEPKATGQASANVSVLNPAYSNGLNVNLKNEEVKKVLNYYEDSNLDVSIDDKKAITYTVDSEIRDSVDKVKLAIFLKCYDLDASLYVVNEDCNYDITSGVATYEDTHKSLLVDNKQPIMFCKDIYDVDENSYITMAYLNDDADASKIAITKDEDNNIKIKGVYKEDDSERTEENDNLNTPEIKEIANGTKIRPAYSTYDDVRSRIIDKTIYDASLIYNDNYYTYGQNFNLSYDTLPDGEYSVCVRIDIDSTKDKDSNSDNVDIERENKVCIYTNQKNVKLQNGKTDSLNIINEEDTIIDGYKVIKDIIKYYKYVIKCNKNLSKDDEQNLYRYLGSWDSYTINMWLREGGIIDEESDTEDYSSVVKTINKKCDENTIDENMILFRNVNEDFLTGAFGVKLPECKNEEDELQGVIKGLTKSEGDELLTTLKNTCVNQSYVEKGIMSTSMLCNENVFRDLPVHLVIKVPKGTHAFVTDNICESEVLLKPNTKLKFTNVELNYDENGDNTYYTLHCTVLE